MEAAKAILDIWESALGTPVETAEEPDITARFTLGEFYPNPFGISTSIQLTLPHPASIELTVFDLLGRKVASLAEGFMNQGTHSFAWNGAGLASGAYLVRLTSEGQVRTRMLFISR